jgi:hypothetical protein
MDLMLWNSALQMIDRGKELLKLQEFTDNITFQTQVIEKYNKLYNNNHINVEITHQLRLHISEELQKLENPLSEHNRPWLIPGQHWHRNIGNNSWNLNLNLINLKDNIDAGKAYMELIPSNTNTLPLKYILYIDNRQSPREDYNCQFITTVFRGKRSPDSCKSNTAEYIKLIIPFKGITMGDALVTLKKNKAMAMGLLYMGEKGNLTFVEHYWLCIS